MLPSGRTFASDNYATAHPAVLEALGRANQGHATAYGGDPYTDRARAKFREHFGEDAEPFFVFNGTSANVLSIQAGTKPYHAVICARSAHIHVHECGATERFTGCKVLTVDTPDGKLTPDLVKTLLRGIGDVHEVQPRMISITQATELGTVYSVAELRALSDFAHANGLLVHMDGARLANAAVSLGTSLRGASRDAGVDVLSFGGTKNGLICGEAVVFFGNMAASAGEFGFIRKQAMQLASKMRFLSVQFEALLSEDLWKRNASVANAMARRLEAGLRGNSFVRVVHPVQANLLFVRIPEAVAALLQETAFFYVMEPVPDADGRVEARWVCSFDTTAEDVDAFLAAIGRLTGRG